MKKKGLVENLKYKYYLLCNPDEIDMPKNLSEEEQKGWIDQVKEEKEKPLNSRIMIHSLTIFLSVFRMAVTGRFPPSRPAFPFSFPPLPPEKQSGQSPGCSPGPAPLR